MTSVLARPAEAGPDEPTRDTSILRLARTDRWVQGALVLIVVQLGYRAWATYGSWYVGDDFFFISRMLNQGLSPSTAFTQYAGHLMPAPLYLSWLFNEVAPYRWWPTATFLLVLQALSSLGLLKLLLVAFGPRRGILPPLVLHLFTAFSVPVSIWWAAGANQLPLQIALFFGLASHVRYLRTGRAVHGLAAFAAVVAGLLFYEKTILVIGAYAIVTLCYFTTGGPLQRLGQVWSRYRAAVVAYAGLGVVYLALYAAFALTFDPGRAATAALGPTAGNIVLRNWLTGVFGGPFHWAAFGKPSAIGDASDLAVAVCAVLLVLLVRELRRTRTRALRALWLPAFFLACDIALVLAGRSSFVGALIALDFRYQGESGAVAAVALACATMTIVGAREGPAPKAASELFDHPRRVATACAVVAVLGLYSATLHTRAWHDDRRAQHYFETLQAGLADQRGATAMVDGTLPDFVAWKAGYPLNTLSHVLRQYSDVARFPGVSQDTLAMVAPDGHVRPVVLPPVRTAVPVVPETQCAYRVGRRDRTVPLTGPLAYGGWWVRIGYIASASSPVTVSAGGASYRTTVQAGLHSLYVKAGEQDFDSVTISALSGQARLCTDDVTVGRPETAPGGTR